MPPSLQALKLLPSASLIFLLFGIVRNRKTWKLLKEQRPYMLIGSPPCTPWSIIQNLNMRTAKGKEKAPAPDKRGF